MESYNKTFWSDNESPPLDAAHLNKMENGIEAATQAITSAESNIQQAQSDIQQAQSNIQQAGSSIRQNATDINNRLIVDTTTTAVEYNSNNPKIIYVNATVDSEKGIVTTTADNTAQFFLGRNGNLKRRLQNGPRSYTSWELFAEKSSNKKNAISSSNRQSSVYYPTIKAVVDYVTLALSNYSGSGNGVDIATITGMLDLKADKSTSLEGYGITDAYTKSEVDDILNIEDGEGVLTCRDSSWVTEGTYYYHRMGDYVDITGKIYFDHKSPIEYETDPETGDQILDEETGEPIIIYPKILNLIFDGLPYICQSDFSINSTTFFRPTGNVSAINVVSGTASILVSDILRRNKDVFGDVITFQLRYRVEV